VAGNEVVKGILAAWDGNGAGARFGEGVGTEARNYVGDIYGSLVRGVAPGLAQVVGGDVEVQRPDFGPWGAERFVLGPWYKVLKTASGDVLKRIRRGRRGLWAGAGS